MREVGVCGGYVCIPRGNSSLVVKTPIVRLSRARHGAVAPDTLVVYLMERNASNITQCLWWLLVSAPRLPASMPGVSDRWHRPSRQAASHVAMTHASRCDWWAHPRLPSCVLISTFTWEFYSPPSLLLLLLLFGRTFMTVVMIICCCCCYRSSLFLRLE